MLESSEKRHVLESRIEEMGDYVTAAFRYLKCARKEMQFLKNKQLELEGPRKVEQ